MAWMCVKLIMCIAFKQPAQIFREDAKADDTPHKIRGWRNARVCFTRAVIVVRQSLCRFI